MKKILSLLLAMITLLAGSAALAAKSKATPTPAPLEIGTDILEPPDAIHRLLEIAEQEWHEVNGKDQGAKNKYTTWFNNYNWGKNRWCAGFVTWCMLEAEIPQQEKANDFKALEEGSAPEPVFHMKASKPTSMAQGYLRMYRTSAVPQKGFIVLYGAGSNKYIHVGIVYDVEERGGGVYRLTCIEGAMKNTVRKFVYDYDATAEKKKNIILVPKEERTEEESRMFTYAAHGKSPAWYVNCFLMPWVPAADQ